MGAGRRSQAVCHHNSPGDTRAEPDAVIGARHVVVHCFRDGDYFDALLVQLDAIAERIVTTYRDEVIYAQEVQVLDYLRGQVIHFVVVRLL